MLHKNFINSQMKLVENQIEDMEPKYREGSMAMKHYLLPKLEKLYKQREKWKVKLAKMEKEGELFG